MGVGGGGEGERRGLTPTHMICVNNFTAEPSFPAFQVRYIITDDGLILQ